MSTSLLDQSQDLLFGVGRERDWWRSVKDGLYGESWWRENVRMSNFEFVCNELRPFVQRQVTRLREPISVEVRVAVTLWRLATNAEYRTIAVLFGLGRSTVCEIVLEMCQTIARHLMQRYVVIPTADGLREIVDGFYHRCGFRHTFGAIDGTYCDHNKVHRTTTNGKDTIQY